MTLCKQCHTRTVDIKQIFTILSLLLTLALPASLFAADSTVKETIKQLQTEQIQLQDKLQQFSVVGNKVISENQKLSEQATLFMWITAVLAAILLGLIGSILAFHKKYKTSLRFLQESTSRTDGNKQFQTNQIANIQKSIGEQRDNLRTLKQQTKESSSQTRKEIEQLKQTFKAFQQLSSDADKQLETLLNKPVDGTLTPEEKEELRTLIIDNNLSFSGNLKARALLEETTKAWQRSINFWETLLTEQGNDTEALLHIGYANYRLAVENSRDDYYIKESMQAFEKIMLSAPEYFDDMQGYDGEETLNVANSFDDDSKEFRLFQQLETFIMRLDELRNYQSIYMLACDYATDGNIQDAQNCLEQIPSVFHAPHCKQLKKDENLSVLRQFDWFNKLIDEACKEKATA